METSPERKRFSIVTRAKSFAHAGRGTWIFVRTTHNAWIQLCILSVVVIFGWYVGISHTDWALLILAAGLVLTAEAFNTAIEIDIDLTSPEFHAFARDTKDVAAGAVLIASLTATAIGLLIFTSYILTAFS
jgi:diacylglycerol kinase (ATP)